jgi:hypothetical protein
MEPQEENANSVTSVIDTNRSNFVITVNFISHPIKTAFNVNSLKVKLG